MKKEYQIGDLVYLVTDVDQKTRMVTAIIERFTHYEYELSCGAESCILACSIETSISKTLILNQ